jgi:hypothetical protein
MTSNRISRMLVSQSGFDNTFFGGYANGRSRMGSSMIAAAAPGSVSVKTTVT